MDTLFLAQFMGALMIIVGLGMLLRRKITLKALDDVFQSPGLLYAIGLAEVAVGLLIIISKEDLEGAIGVIILILGWVLLIEGVMYLTATLNFMKKILKWLHRERAFYFLSTVYVVLGAWLVYVASL